MVSETSEHFDAVITGSGFAGSILARILARTGRRVLLLERFEHPRFALGESSTPLSAILLETLAARYGLADLADLAAYGRWTRELGHLRRGLKRGFTFYVHRPGREWTPGPDNENRLLVAASPADEVADAHWHRADVDAHLVERAAAAGVDYRDRAHVARIERSGAGWRFSGQARGGTSDGRRQQAFRIEADFFVDASGRRGAAVGASLARPLPSSGSPPTRLVYAHLAGVPAFASLAARGLEPGPYPDDSAAVHHLIDEGWIYVLPFDHGVASVGLILAEPAPAAIAPEAVWRRIVGRYPTLARQLNGAEALVGWSGIDLLPHRLDRPAGDGWLVLPGTYAFYDPMFSTGIAWSLAAIERVARMFEASGRPEPEAVERYAGLLSREADHLAGLIRGAYLARQDFRRFVAFAQLYFAAASFQEAGRRLAPGFADWTWEGFLGAGDREISGALAGAIERLQEPRPDSRRAEDFERWINGAIARRNLAGLADPARRNLYPVDLKGLVRSSSLLGLSRAEVEAALPRLRGEPAAPLILRRPPADA